MATESMPRTSEASPSRTRGADPVRSGVDEVAVSGPGTSDTDWAFYAVVGTSVQGGHTLARFGPEPTALAALKVAVQAVNHTAYSMLEQGYHGDPCAESPLLERLPITDFNIERRRPGSAESDTTWGLTGGRHQRGVSRRRVA
ncbi:hypothetical protein [Rhodococcus sp. Q]|uniref:hypothetical protein n=1 Tax=Rhodococcus sp. Q TaxID=2502252 RepID=UPI0020166B14|nr:hypothetical protein [Rhodococcus sp. Q]